MLTTTSTRRKTTGTASKAVGQGSAKTVLIGYHAAIAAGTAICKSAKRASESKVDVERHAGRGACIYAMDNLWYDAMTDAAKGKFEHDRDAFYKQCGWPE